MGKNGDGYCLNVGDEQLRLVKNGFFNIINCSNRNACVCVCVYVCEGASFWEAGMSVSTYVYVLVYMGR